MWIVSAIAALVIASAMPAFAGSAQTSVLDVQNMTCPLCPITVKKSLQAVPGVVEVKIDLDKKTATVRFDPDKADIAALIKATTNAGFPARVQR